MGEQNQQSGAFLSIREVWGEQGAFLGTREGDLCLLVMGVTENFDETRTFFTLICLTSVWWAFSEAM